MSPRTHIRTRKAPALQRLAALVMLLLILSIGEISPSAAQNTPPPPPPGATGMGAVGPDSAPSGYIPPVTGDDITDSLALKSGMKIYFDIKSGLDTRWKPVGDYIFEATIDYNDGRGYAFDWHMSPPANASGSRAVDAEDMREAHKVSLFYPDNESATLIGYTSIVRVSDYHYKRLKAGQGADFHLDGPDSLQVLKKPVRPTPETIHLDGVESLTINIDHAPVQVRTLRCKTDVGWSYWILDNARFPMLIQGDGPFQWKASMLSYTGIKKGSGTSGSGNKKARDEANKVIDQLNKSGKAISHLILFDFDSDRLRPLSKEILVEISKYLRQKPNLHLRVEGHTCNIGSKHYNLDLSQRRAESVKRFLVEHCGIDTGRLVPIGYGFSRPMASNGTEAGRRKNRRVVFSTISQ